MKKQLLFGHILTLLIGGFIYFFFRTEKLIMFNWKENYNTSIMNIRTLISTYYDKFPNWFLFSLPKGLWLFPYISLVLLIRRNKIHRENFLWIIIIPILIILSELGQLLKIVPETYDFLDILFYSLGAILPILIFTEYFNFKIKIV